MKRWSRAAGAKSGQQPRSETVGPRLDCNRGKRFLSSPKRPTKLLGPPSLLSNLLLGFVPQG